MAERLGVPIVHDQHESLSGHGVRDVLQEEQGRVIGPVRVVEDDHDEPVMRQQTQQPIDRIEQPEAVLPRTGAIGLVLFPREQVRREPRQLGGQTMLPCQGWEAGVK